MGVIISEKVPARCRAYLSVCLEQTVPKPLAGADGMYMQLPSALPLLSSRLTPPDTSFYSENVSPVLS